MTVQERLAPLTQEIISKYNEGITSTQLCKDYDANHFYIYNILKDGGVEIRKKHGALEGRKDEILELFDSGLTSCAVSKKLGLPLNSVNRFIKKYREDYNKGSTRRDIPLDTYDNEIILWYLSGTGCYTIAKKYECNETSIRALLIRNGIDTTYTPKYTYDKNFWDKIDTEAKAWALGLFYTDGYNSDYGITISLTDRDMVEKLRHLMKYSGPIRYIEPRTERHKPQYKIFISGKAFSQKLTDLGCMRAKTFTLKFPSEDIVPKHLMPAMIRGVLDGDGTINWYLGFAGNINFLNGVEKYIEEQIGVAARWYNNCPENGEDYIIRQMRFACRNDIKKALRWIYQDATIYGDRKFAKAQEWLALPDTV